MEKSAFFGHLIETGQFVITEDGHAMLLGEFALLIPSRIFLELHELLEKNLGRREAEKIIETLGEFQVEAALERYRKRFKINKIEREKLKDFLFKLFNIMGWGGGTLNKISYEKKYAEFIMTNSTLGKKYLIVNKRKSKYPIDFYIVGWLKKVFETLFGSKVKVIEIKCLAKGDQFCEFIISQNSKKS